MQRTQPPRERAARALCRLAGNPENTRFEGAPMWRSYLPEVEAVLQAALTPEELQRLDGVDPD
ncbi:MAG: hypothetical protein WCZ72_08155 [Gemmobacter sp.]